MTRDDTGRHAWPTHAEPTPRSRLAAGHAAGQTGNGGRAPTAAERKNAEAIRAAIARGVQVSPAMRMAAGYDALTTDDQEN
jgi:hypothetical protein